MPLNVEEVLYAFFLISGSAIIINVSVYKWCHSLYMNSKPKRAKEE